MSNASDIRFVWREEDMTPERVERVRSMIKTPIGDVSESVKDTVRELYKENAIAAASEWLGDPKVDEESIESLRRSVLFAETALLVQRVTIDALDSDVVPTLDGNKLIANFYATGLDVIFGTLEEIVAATRKNTPVVRLRELMLRLSFAALGCAAVTASVTETYAQAVLNEDKVNANATES